MKKRYKVLIIITSVVLLISIVMLLWLNDYYKATNEVDDYLTSTNTVEVFNDDDLKYKSMVYIVYVRFLLRYAANWLDLTSI